jgi:hypothetical protein
MIKPTQDQSNIISEISFELTYNANNFYADDQDVHDLFKNRKPLCDKFRALACRLEAISGSILWYNILARCRFVIPMKDIIKARGLLIGISNDVFTTHEELAQSGKQGYQSENAKEVKRLLKVKFD